MRRVPDQDLFGDSSEVSWRLDLTTIRGTLVRPSGSGPFLAVVMVAGSGPTDRDWNSPLLPGSNGSAPLLADALAAAGIASLRYDKTGSGPNVRENMQGLIGKLSMQSHVDELAGAVRTIASQDYVQDGKIFALTNSEGALHALNYQLNKTETPFAGVVLTAPPGRAVGAVARSQLAAQATGVPNGNELMAAYDAAIARFLVRKPAAPEASLPEGVRMLLQSLENPANLPFARELWAADATALLRKVAIPVLVIIGKRDIQVDWQVDGEPLERAAAGRDDVTFLFPENANHVLKHEARPRSELVSTDVVAGYNASDPRLDREVQTGILAWLAAHV
jgi:uncharacterized protein